mgnify:CR=1 FL=1
MKNSLRISSLKKKIQPYLCVDLTKGKRSIIVILGLLKFQEALYEGLLIF